MGFFQDNDCEGFDWDEGNSYKSWEKHGVPNDEAEQVFSNDPYFAYRDDDHSLAEERQIVMGKTDKGKPVFICFTLRGRRLRPISSRWMGRRDRKRFDEEIEGNTKI